MTLDRDRQCVDYPRRTQLRGAILAAVVALAGVAAAGWITRSSIGEALSRYDPTQTLVIIPRDPLDLIGASERDLSKSPPQVGAAFSRLRTALLADPLNARIYADLGLVALLRDDRSDADQLFAIAVRRSRREAVPDLWAFDRSVFAGDFASACKMLDILLRTQPSSLLNVLAEKVADLSDSPGAWAPLTRLLGTNPPWRTGLLQLMSASMATAHAVEPILVRLSRTAHPATEAEVATLLEAKIAEGDFRRASEIWRELSPSGRAAAPGLLNNGRFQIDASQTPFAWTPAPDVGGMAILGALAGGTGLRVILNDRAPQAPLVSQLLVVTPGDYTLAGSVRAPESAVAADIGLSWMLVCAGTRQVLFETPAIAGDDRWRRFAIVFRVPGRQCAGQWLELHRRGSLTGLSDGAIVWFDAFSLASTSAAVR